LLWEIFANSTRKLCQAGFREYVEPASYVRRFACLATEDSAENLPEMELCSNSTKVTAYLESRNVGSFTDHPYRNDPSIRGGSEVIDDLMSFRSPARHNNGFLTQG
jgi:hypothetical protein|tara:strand:- start:70 stop:387 length:318 start_codon:yes stop_codon:yes gene_type:complete